MERVDREDCWVSLGPKGEVGSGDGLVYLRVSLGGKEYEPQLTSIPCLEGQIREIDEVSEGAQGLIVRPLASS